MSHLKRLRKLANEGDERKGADISELSHEERLRRARFPKATQRLRDYQRAYDAPSPDHAGIEALLKKLG